MGRSGGSVPEAGLSSYLSGLRRAPDLCLRRHERGLHRLAQLTSRLVVEHMRCVGPIPRQSTTRTEHSILLGIGKGIIPGGNVDAQDRVLNNGDAF
jgi:hypothetical protein